jgi:hypothetical protein
MNLSVRYLGISHDDCNKNEKWLRADGMHGLVTFMKLVNLHTLALAKSSTYFNNCSINDELHALKVVHLLAK